MPYKQKATVKLYYSIGEVAAMFAVKPSLIRFWENEFEVLKPTKNKKGNRMFTAEDIENLKEIFRLVKGEGYTLQGAKEKLKMKEIEEEDKQVRVDETVEQKREIIEKLHKIRNWLQFLENEI
ncbi:MAG: MerR family transcriptional regulator [Flavobacteriales bacterium]